MKRIKTTAKEVRDVFEKKIALGCCEAVELLRGRKPSLYTCGVYGWNFDVYIVEDAAICVGVRGMIGVHPDRELVKSYEDRARDIWNGFDRPYKERAKQVDALLRQLLREVFAE